MCARSYQRLTVVWSFVEKTNNFTFNKHKWLPPDSHFSETLDLFRKEIWKRSSKILIYSFFTILRLILFSVSSFLCFYLSDEDALRTHCIVCICHKLCCYKSSNFLTFHFLSDSPTSCALVKLLPNTFVVD